jgi:hypothetical protein
MFDEFLTQLTLLAIASPGKKSRKKLVAEIGAAFLCADLGITPETRDVFDQRLWRESRPAESSISNRFCRASRATRSSNPLSSSAAASAARCASTVASSTPASLPSLCNRLGAALAFARELQAPYPPNRRRGDPRCRRSRPQHFPSGNACARPRARDRRKSKTVAGRQGRALVDRPADPWLPAAAFSLVLAFSTSICNSETGRAPCDRA